MIEEIRVKYPITDEEALVIREVTDEKSADSEIHSTVIGHKNDLAYLEGSYKSQVRDGIRAAYENRQRYDEMADPNYTDTGAIFDIMARNVVHHHLSSAV